MIIKSDNGYPEVLSSVKHFTNIHFMEEPRRSYMWRGSLAPSQQKEPVSLITLHMEFGAPSCQKRRLSLRSLEPIPSHHRNSAVSCGCPVLSDLNKIGPSTESLSSPVLRLLQLLSIPHCSFKFQLQLTSKTTANIYWALQSALCTLDHLLLTTPYEVGIIIILLLQMMEWGCK